MSAEPDPNKKYLPIVYRQKGERFSEESRKAFIALLRAGHKRPAACTAVGVDYGLMQKWMTLGRDQGQAVKDVAQPDGSRKLVYVNNPSIGKGNGGDDHRLFYLGVIQAEFACKMERIANAEKYLIEAGSMTDAPHSVRANETILKRLDPESFGRYPRAEREAALARAEFERLKTEAAREAVRKAKSDADRAQADAERAVHLAEAAKREVTDPIEAVIMQPKLLAKMEAKDPALLAAFKAFLAENNMAPASQKTTERAVTERDTSRDDSLELLEELFNRDDARDDETLS